MSDKTFTLFTRISGKLARFESDAQDHVQAILLLRRHLGHSWDHTGRWSNPPVLAVIEGGLTDRKP